MSLKSLKKIIEKHRLEFELFINNYPTPVMVKNYNAAITAENYISNLKISENEKYKLLDTKFQQLVEIMRVEWDKREKDIENKNKEFEQKNYKEFVQNVFNYFKYQFDPELKCDNPILLDEAFDFTKRFILGEPINQKRWITLITALTQSGKTFIAIAIVCIELALGLTPVFIVKDIHQKNQFVERYIKICVGLCRYLEKKGFPKKLTDRYKDYSYKDSKTTGKNFFTNCLNGKERKLIICIHEHTHLERILNDITDKSNLALFIDEAHKLGGYKNSDGTHNPYVKYDNNLAEIKKYAKKIYLITATPQDILVSEPNLYSKGVVFLPAGKDYVGITDWSLIKIDEDTEEEISMNIQDNVTKVKSSFFETMSELSEKQPIKRIDKFGKEGYHPINVLARFENENQKQYLLLESFKPKINPVNNHHENMIKSNWAVMTFNQFGVHLYHESLKNTPVVIGTETFFGNEEGDIFFKGNIQIGEVWQWLALNGGVKRFPRLCTIAYKAAEEGITFCSTWTGNQETDFSWHITHAYVRMGNSACSSHVEQCFCRANGNHGDNIKPTIYCINQDRSKLFKGFNLHDEQVKAILNLKRNEGDVKVLDFVRKIPIADNRVPKRVFTFPGGNSLLNTYKNPEGKMEDQVLSLAKKATSCLSVINPETYGEENRQKLFEKLDMFKQKIDINNGMDYIKRAYEDNTSYIHKIIQTFIDKDFEALSVAEIRKAVNNPKLNITNYDHWDISHNKYMVLRKTATQKYIVCENVVEKLNLIG